MASTVSYQGLSFPVDSPYGRELMKFERPRDYRPENHPYPMMLYKAHKGSNGRVECLRNDPSPYEYTKEQMAIYHRDMEAVRTFNESCQKVVMDQDQHAIAKGQGWRESPQEAVTAADEAEYRLQEETVSRIKRDMGMSEKAKAEIEAAQAATTEQLAVMPEAPRVKKVHWKTLQKLEKEKAAAAA